MSLTKPYVSRYMRKENYETLNHPYSTPLNMSPHQSNITSSQPDHSAQKRSLQQKQIEDLEQKVDIILQHNDKLAAENAQLKRQLALALESIQVASLQKERVSRFQAQDNDYSSRKTRSELQIKIRESEALTCELQASRQAYSKQIEGLKIIITNLSNSIDQTKLQNIKLTQQILKIRDQCQQDKRMSIREAQRKNQEESSKLLREKSEEAIREKNNYNKRIEDLNSKFEGEKAQWQQRKNILIAKLQQNHNKEINQLRDQMMSQFNEQLHKLEEEATERCKNEREKAENFIKETLEGISNNNENETQSLKQQINALQISLQNRKLIIKSLTSQQSNAEEENHDLQEFLELKRRLKQQIQYLMRQNEVLKIRTAEKYQRDLKQMVRIYDDKIDILSAQITQLRMQNQRLRKNYEGQLQNKIRQRKTWEIEAGQLKNIVRKLKAQLLGIQEQFKLNIDGIRDQNATFSMTMMKSMIQDKDKANFFEDQNRKLRALYQKHENEVQMQKKQAIEKVKFYESKLEHLKKLIQVEKEQFDKKEQYLENKWNERETATKQTLKKERILMQETIDSAVADKEKIEKELFDTLEKCHHYQLDIKQKKQDLSLLQSRIKQNQGHIQRLRMELQIVGTEQREKQVNRQWKEHYEEIILKLESDKEELKKSMDSQNQKIQRLVYKYKLLQEQLRKASETMVKYGTLDKKVIQLGMDENIVKNMSQIFARVNF